MTTAGVWTRDQGGRNRMAGRGPGRRHCNNPAQELTGPGGGQILDSEKLPLADGERRRAALQGTQASAIHSAWNTALSTEQRRMQQNHSEDGLLKTRLHHTQARPSVSTGVTCQGLCGLSWACAQPCSRTQPSRPPATFWILWKPNHSLDLLAKTLADLRLSTRITTSHDWPPIGLLILLQQKSLLFPTTFQKYGVFYVCSKSREPLLAEGKATYLHSLPHPGKSTPTSSLVAVSTRLGLKLCFQVQSFVLSKRLSIFLSSSHFLKS